MGKRILRKEEERSKLLKSRDRQLSWRFLERVKKRGQELQEKLGRPPVFMEVCGTHTVAFSKTGLRKALEGLIDLRSGPGCPVCVTGYGDMDRIIALSRLEDVTIGTFGDMFKVPGSRSSLEREKALGSRVEIFYSPLDSVQWAERNPSQNLIFIGVGFETTAPMVALSLQKAKDKGLNNFSVLSLHKLVPPALRVLLADIELKIDGFILPGNVSAVTGREAFEFVSREFSIPAVIAGFEPVDLLGALDNLTGQILEGTCRVDNIYTRVAKEQGNSTAQRVIKEFFDVVDESWRGLGTITCSGLVLKEDLEKLDASKRFTIEIPAPEIPAGCRCGDVLAGKIIPSRCKLFGKECRPDHPVGACMVSSEGACGAYHQYDNQE